MSPSSRRLVGTLLQICLVVLAIGIFGRYVLHKVASGRKSLHVETVASLSDSLGPGDLRIYSADSAIDIVLRGNQLLSGLSPKTVAKVREDLDTSSSGGSIGRLVKQTVSSAIGTHAAFDLADIRDIRYEDGRLVFDWTDGTRHDFLNSTTVNGNKASNAFREMDARRLIDAFHARKNAMAAK